MTNCEVYLMEAKQSKHLPPVSISCPSLFYSSKTNQSYLLFKKLPGIYSPGFIYNA